MSIENCRALAYSLFVYCFCLLVIADRFGILKYPNERSKYREVAREFTSIDSSINGDSYTSLKKIRDFYNDDEEVGLRLRDGSLLLRKSHLLNNIVERSALKEIMVVFLSAVFGAFVARIFEIMVSTEPQKDYCFLGGYIAFALIVLSIIAMNVINYSFEDSKGQLYRYEISLIDESLEKLVDRSVDDVNV